MVTEEQSGKPLILRVYCCWIAVMLHCSMNIQCTTLTDHLFGVMEASMFLSNSQNSSVKSLFAVTTRLQSCWHLWKWIELRIRGFVTNPICHLPKWSQILDYMLLLVRGWWATVGLKPFTGAGFTFHCLYCTTGIWLCHQKEQFGET